MEPRGPKKLIGQILLEKGLITQERLDEALSVQKNTQESLGRILIDLGDITERNVFEAYAQQLGIPFYEPMTTRVDFDPKLAKTIPQSVVQCYGAIPIKLQGNRLTVAMIDPCNVFALDDIRLITGYEIDPVLICGEDLEELEKKIRENDPDAQKLDAALQALDGIAKSEESPGTEFGISDDILRSRAEEEVEKLGPQSTEDEAPMVRVANVIIIQAIKDRASTIRIEADRRGVRVRYRIDGELHEVMWVPKYVHSKLVAKFKEIAGVNVAEHQLAQDGIINIRHEGRDYVLPTHFMPAHFGELVEVHIRLARLIPLGKLGFPKEVSIDLKELLTVSKGLVLFYATDRMMLTQLLYGALDGNIRVENSVLIAEEEPFIDLPGTEQVRVNPKAGLTMASILRQSQKHDIDVMLVSRIPDLETAVKLFDFPDRRIIAGMEVNDTAQAFYSLMGMGVDPYNVALRVTAVVGCRQVRKPCPRCREPRTVQSQYQERLKQAGLRFAETEDPAITYFGRGCAACRHTGHHGLTGVFEVVVSNDELKDTLLKFPQISPKDRKIALSRATRWSFAQDVEAKLFAGETTLEEAIRILR